MEESNVDPKDKSSDNKVIKLLKISPHKIDFAS